jgi:5'-3' exonuclease
MPKHIRHNQRALIDADILVYRIGFTTEDEPEGIARVRMDTSINEMLDAIEAENYTCYLTSSDKSNFRYEMFPEYKAHRVQPKPKHYYFLREYLLSDYQATLVEGQEADDQIGIDSTKLGDESIICTIDKDLDQIPGWHYNFVKGRMYEISVIEGYRSFYEQCLVGDTTDNIKGCPGIGKVKAQRRLEGCQSEKEMLETVVDGYEGAYQENEWADRLLLAGNLLWIRREPGQRWTHSWGEAVSKIGLEDFYKNMGSSLSTNQT